MRYRINQIKLRPGEGRGAFADAVKGHKALADDAGLHKALADAVRKKLGKPGLRIEDIRIVKESIDARKKPDVRLVYTLDFSCRERLRLPQAAENEYEPPSAINAAGETERPVIVGFGPCGMFAALILAEAGMKPLVIERGQRVEERIRSVERFWKEGVLDTESNVQFGEGGAGTFSDGKLTTGIKDIRITKVLAEFVAAGADAEILYKQKPHIGTDRLRGVVRGIRKKIEVLGGEIMFDTRLTGIVSAEAAQGRRLSAVKTVSRDGRERIIKAESLVLAIGHSARDTFAMLLEEGFEMEQKPFSIGVRIEHPQEMINAAQYGDAGLAEILGAADYKLNHRCENGRGVYTFCMCPGGLVIDASSEPGTAVTNGMSNSDRRGAFANSGLLVDVRTEDFGSDHPLAGVEFQRRYERLAYENGGGRLPRSTYGEFRSDSGDVVRRSIPGFAAEAITEAMPFLGRRLAGFDSDEAVMTAVETRSSSPVRILRDELRQANVRGVYPAGEGPGYAGGIMSAAVDGIRTAERIIEAAGNGACRRADKDNNI